MTRIPSGQLDRSSRSVISATQAPSRISSWASYAGVHPSFGINASSSGVLCGKVNPAE
jgi:hypothetical protein